MAEFKIKPAGSAFLRPGGRDGDWWPDPQDDDHVASPFDFVEVPGDLAVEALAHLRRTIADKTPVLFGSPHNYGLLIEQMDEDESDPADILSELKTLDLDQWFSGRVGEVQVWQEDLGKVVPPRGPWPRSAVPVTVLRVTRDETIDETYETVMIGLLPTTLPYEVPAFLNFGGWDDSPEPVVHVALAREWGEHFQATIAAITHDSIEYQVGRPPKTRDEAERLALEHFHYSRAALPGTLQEAAASLIGSTVWRFTWD